MGVSTMAHNWRPRRPRGKERKLDRGATRLPEEDLHRRPEATHGHRARLLFEHLGVRASEATVYYALKHLGRSPYLELVR